MEPFIVQTEEKPKSHFWLKLFLASFLIAVFICIGLGLFAVSYVRAFEDRVYPGIKIGDYEIGKMTENELRSFIENINTRYSKEGIDVVVENTEKTPNTVKLSTILAGEAALEAIEIDSRTLSKEAINFGKSGNRYERYVTPFIIRFEGKKLNVPVTSRQEFKELVKESLAHFEVPHQNAGIKNINELLGSAQVVPEKSGSSFDYDEVVDKIRDSFARISFEPVRVSLKDFKPWISSKDAESILPKLQEVIQAGPINLFATSTTATTTEWVLEPRIFKNMIEVVKTQEGKMIFSLNKEAVTNYLSAEILPILEIPAEDAKFAIENNKVKEFKASRSGLTIDLEKTFEDLRIDFEKRNVSGHAPARILVQMETKLPGIQTADINAFGIVEIIGVGSSTFKDSHSRRIKNIAHAVERLNGTLIQPDEEFSTIRYAGPFTAENGYLPEAVIKGNIIKDEIGGGMCQIGTTLFRMAMQSGLEITQRRNHSLVVSYYADPVNGNPGTDATIYEPYLDLKFLNDTGNYLLLTTEIDYKKQQLTFTLWGTKDGRSGSFTRPKVSKWIAPPAEVEYILSDKLKPGEERCQPAYRGAVASFTYTRVTPHGEKIEKVYDSYYRPLQKICTVGPTTTQQIVVSP